MQIIVEVRQIAIAILYTSCSNGYHIDLYILDFILNQI